ncbi:MAG: hypothetical protein IJD81_05525 [Oscillospiraceae bacterium]|nr:hypothetical protein [Oscillospiraceae bacterium]
MKYRLLCLLFTLLLLSGCSTGHKQVPMDDGYSTDTATDALNYTTYMDKELGLVMNLLATHLGNSRTALDSTALTANETQSVAENLLLIADAIDSVDTLRPPDGYEDLRNSALRRLEEAQEAIMEYQSALVAADAEAVDTAITRMESAYVSLTGAFTVMPE